MKVTRSMLEQDARYLLDSVRDADYEIPSSGAVFKTILKVYGCVFFIQLAGVLADWMIYARRGDYYSYSDIAILSTVSLVVIFAVLCVMLYQNVSFALCIPEDVRNNSLICKIIRKKLKAYFVVVVLFNMLVALILLYCGHRHVSYLGASWFFSLIVGGLSFSFSMSRYFTPPVISALNKIAETVSLAGAGK
ncbi:protein traS [Salmonella enterica]|nr:protein traS [Salmonella enterica subsp. enterica serovar Pensacola]ELT8728638.1 protein traS [Salmonella enterica]